MRSPHHGHARSYLSVLAVLAAGSALTAPLLPAQTKHPIGIDEYITLRTAGDPQISPDGSRVIFTISSTSLQDNKSTSKIWMVELGSGRMVQLTAGAGSDRAPRWSPDGRSIVFLSNREGGSQLWRLPLQGGEAERLSAFSDGVSDFLPAPDGKVFYFTSDVKWPDTTEIDRRNGPYPTGARIWTDLYYRHWNEWRVGIRSHLFRLNTGDGSVLDITPIDADVPPLALGGKDIAISPANTELAIVYNPDSVIATSTNNDVFLMGIDGEGRQAITTNKANDNSPAYSPDGRTVAYLAMSVPGFEADRQEIMLFERASGKRIALTPDWNLSVSAITWLPDSKGIIAEVEERGEHVFYRVDVPGGKRTRLIGGGFSTALQVTPGGDRFIYLHSSANHPLELWTAKSDGKEARPVTHLHDDLFASLDVRPVERFGFIGSQGDSVFGWLMKPPGFDSTKKYPLVYLIHGGPQGAWLDQWHSRWNYALFAARGYVVAAVNFHGSTGYGQAFTNSISRHWGDIPYEDLMKGLDALSARPWIDAARMGAAGASYGGYMVYWMAGHTDRFKVLVAHDGVFNNLSMAGSTEELWFPEHEFGGTMLDREGRATMDMWSPVNSVAQWKTPMLIVHSQNDFRIELSEGLQAYTALKLLGVPAKFLYFPDEDHWVNRPRNRRIWWGTVLDWLDKYLK
ncbi:MAG TPA: S9 family peptidase [Gemmatimonadales bacterium]|nr:S9 family peptidase [Gemmatimonadales bacterium]